MNKKTTCGTTSAAPTTGDAVAQSIEGERDKTGLKKLLNGLSARFISLNRVIETIAEANDGSVREAARVLGILLEGEADFPPWYRWTDAKSKGTLDPENGANWGLKLLQHAQMTGEPVEFPHIHWRDCGYDLSAMPEGSVYHFLVSGPNLGFQTSDVGAFLSRHGLNGFAAHEARATPAGIDEPGQANGRAGKVSVHLLDKGRSDVLWPIIEKAMHIANSNKTAAVWAQLERFAALPDKPAPLQGVNSGGIQYRNGLKIPTFTIKALGDRLRRLRRANAR